MGRSRGQRRGYLRVRGPSWFLEWREDVRLASGAIARRRVGRVLAPASGPGALSRREAERIAWGEVLGGLQQPGLYPASVMTVGEFARSHFAQRVALRKPSGQAHYRYLLERHVLPVLSELRLRDVEAVDVQRLLNSKLAAGLSVQTVVHIRNCVSALFRHARRLRLFAGEFPTEGLELPRLQAVERIALTVDQVRAIAARLPALYRLLVLFLASTGLRIGEAVALRWSDIDARVGVVRVGRAYVRKRGRLDPRGPGERYAAPKSAAGVRTVPLGAGLLELLVGRRGTAGKAELVFAGSTGRPLDAHNVLRRFLKPAAEALGVAGVTWHGLRHSAATFADQEGLSAAERQRVLGHSSARMTAHYTHAEMERTRGRLSRVADRLLSPEQLSLLQ